MNDLYLTNGKTGHYRNLGLPKANNIQADWPTPRQIKLNATKRETVPVAFRIDEVAFTMLNLFAEQCDLTTSAFVNELINSYIRQHEHEVEGSVFNSTINLSIERLASKMKKMSIEQAILNYHQELLRNTIELLANEKIPKGDISFCKLDTFKQIFEAYDFRYLQTYFLNCAIDIDLGEEASVTDLRKESPEARNDFGFADFSMWIPLKKWVFVQPLLALYDTKCEQFLTNYKYTEIRNNTNYDEIVEIINKFDGSELVEELADKLKFKGGVWSKTLQK